MNGDADDGVFWPCPSKTHPGTPRLFLDRFGTEDGRARFHAVDHRPPAETPDGLFPYFLTTRRVLMQYNSGTQTRRNAELREAAPEPFVEIHPETAQTLGIGDGDLVSLTTRRGRAVFGSSRHPAEMCLWKSCCRSAGLVPPDSMADLHMTSPIILLTVMIPIVGITFMAIGTITRRSSGRGATKRKSLFPWKRCGKRRATSRSAFTDAKAWFIPPKNRTDGSSFSCRQASGYRSWG